MRGTPPPFSYKMVFNGLNPQSFPLVFLIWMLSGLYLVLSHYSLSHLSVSLCSLISHQYHFATFSHFPYYWPSLPPLYTHQLYVSPLLPPQPPCLLISLFLLFSQFPLYFPLISHLSSLSLDLSLLRVVFPYFIWLYLAIPPSLFSFYFHLVIFPFLSSSFFSATLSPRFMLSFIFILYLLLYICSLTVSTLCHPFCSACIVRPYEMSWYKWHFMHLCSTTRPNTAGSHKGHCLLCMPLLMCSIWFNTRDRWGGIEGEASEVRMRESLALRMKIKGINRQG